MRNTLKSGWRRLAIVTVLTVAGIGSVHALSQGSFDAFEIRKVDGMEMQSIAVADTSAASQNWLRRNTEYLLSNKIPIIVINSTNDDLSSMQASFGELGRQMGLAPKPTEYLEELLQYMGVNHYPVVIENGIAWQAKP